MICLHLGGSGTEPLDHREDFVLARLPDVLGRFEEAEQCEACL